MKVEALKTESRVTKFDDLRFKVRRYGLANDYPQKAREILQASGTGSLCVNLYSKFIKGKGFKDDTLGKILVNKNLKLSQLYNKICDDLGIYRGYAVHINYNGLLQKINFQFIPFEFCRLAIDENRELTGQIGVHPDWGSRRPGYRQFRASDIVFIDRYTEDPKEIKEQIKKAGGFDKWNGHIFWYSPEFNDYPLCSFDPVISDMSTEESVATVKNRNAKNNFMPAGAFVSKGKNTTNGADNDPFRETTTEQTFPQRTTKDDDSDIDKALIQLQGDSKACKILSIKIDTEEEMPQFIEFPMKNYDRAFELTERTIQQNIGNIFNQPPVLRGQLVAGKLATSSEIEDAYNYYNSVTENERNINKENLETIFKGFPGIPEDIEILPLNYGFAKPVNNDQNVSQ